MEATCGFIALALVRGFHAPVVATVGYFTSTRVLSSMVGCMFTAFLNLALDAGQPAAFSTTLLVILGSYESLREALSILVTVELLAL